MKKALFVATVVKTHILQFHIPYLRMLKERGWETAVAAKNDFDDPRDCTIPFCDAYYDVAFARNPFHPRNLRAYRRLRRLIDEGAYDLIHCHTPVGAAIARLAARGARKKGTKVVYTAHGFHFYKGAPLLNWLLYYPAEKWLSRFTDVLITINREDYERVKGFHAKECVYIPGVGIDCSRFSPSPEIRAQKRTELGIPRDATVLLSVGEVNKNKNHAVILEALPDLPDCWFVLCGRGPLLERHRQRARELGIEDRVLFAGYRTDVADFYKMADVFVFPSLREGLPVSVMEAMAAGLPVLCTRIRGSADLVTEGENGFFFDADSPGALVRIIRSLPSCTQDFGKANAEKAQGFSFASVAPLYQQAYGMKS